MSAAVVAVVGSLLAELVADADLATSDRLAGLPGLRAVTELVVDHDGTVRLVVA